MVGAADGSVRVWRDYTFRGTQRLATAWQARSAPKDPNKPLLRCVAKRFTACMCMRAHACCLAGCVTSLGCQHCTAA
jgi:hypothetical protein